MFRATSYIRGCVHVVDPVVPWESHYIFGSGWVGVYVVYSENGREGLYAADTMSKVEIIADLGPAIWGRVVDTLGKAPEKVLNNVKAQRGVKSVLAAVQNCREVLK